MNHQFQPSFSRATLMMLVGAPLVIMTILTLTVLFPALKDPSSSIYRSKIGYPSLKRLIGQPIKVEAVPVEFKTLDEGVAAPGESVALQTVNVSSQLAGIVERVMVAEGDVIRRGQPLIQLQRAPFENSVDAARSNVAIAESALRAIERSTPDTQRDLIANVKRAQERVALAQEQIDRLQAVVAEGALPASRMYDQQDQYVTRQKELENAENALALAQQTNTSDLENARLTLDNKRIELQQALRNLNNTTIYANTDALVSRVNIHPGESAAVNASVLTLTQDVVLKAYIDQARLNAIKVGDKAKVNLVAYPGRTFEGQVTRLNPTIQTEGENKPSKVGPDRQYTYSVWIKINELQLPPGLQGYVQFGGDKAKRYVIPEKAVTHLSGGEGMVMIVEGGQAVTKRVRLGQKVENQREVLAGLTPDQQVVLSPQALNPGDHLKIEVAQR